MPARGQALGAVVLALSLAPCRAQLVGPGGVTTYSGGGAQQSRGYGYVRDPAEGFFVGGSTLEAMNGVYKRVANVPQALDEKKQFQMVYRKWHVSEEDDGTGWHMGMSEKPDGGTEWLIIDDAHNDRFTHEGGTVIPGSGNKWSHVHGDGAAADDASASGSPQPGDPNYNAVAETKGDDMDQLPWQVIYIGDLSMTENLRHHHQHHHSNVQSAITGGDLPEVPECRDGQVRDVCETAPPQPAVPAAEKAVTGGHYGAAASLYEAELGKGCLECSKEQEQWRLASLNTRMASCLRLDRQFTLAMDSLGIALRFFPRYKEALLERGKTLLDAGRPAVGLKAFEQLLNVDRLYPGLDKWLVLAHAHEKRAAEAMSSPHTHMLAPPPEDAERKLNSAIEKNGFQQGQVVPGADYYTVLGVPADFSAEQLKRAYKKMSKKTHPDRNGGSNEMFQLVAAAYATLGDPKKKALYDAGDEIERGLKRDGSQGESHQEVTERKYFPDRFMFLPFGDPFEGKRHWQSQKAQEAPEQPNAEGVPKGSYEGSCNGCSLIDEGKVLRCTQCSDEHMQRTDSTISVTQCASGEHIGNHNGKLACEPVNPTQGHALEGMTDEQEAEDPEGQDAATADAAPNEEGVPVGTYLESCQGCRLLSEGTRLECAQCSYYDANLGQAGHRVSQMRMGQCGEHEQIGNQDGVLACEAKREEGKGEL